MRFYFYKSEARRYVWHAGAARCGAVRGVRRGVRGGRGRGAAQCAECGAGAGAGRRSVRSAGRARARGGAGVMAIIDGTIYESLKVFVGKRKRLAFKNGLHNLLNSI